jgi:hypothetical protein
MIIACVLTWTIGLPVAQADEQVYRAPDEFLATSFGGSAPAAQALWIDPSLRGELVDRYGWQPGLRVRFWQQDQRTAWILDEIGKDKPITAGFVIVDGAIEQAEVLVFRESRGWEIRHSFFTSQFARAALTSRGELDRRIDGITGATLSVRAMERMARVALKLHEQSQRTTLAKYP